MTLHQFVVAATGCCAAASVLLSAALIQQHLQHFSQPLVQSKVVGILWMVPIYSIDSWLSLSFKDAAIYLDMLRDCYEAYVLYLFLALLVAYLGGGDEEKVVELLEKQPRVNHMLPFSLCFGKGSQVPHGRAFLRFCKFGTMQYIVLKPTCTLVALVLHACGLYGEGTFAFNRFWVYQTIIMNLSVGYAFYCLGLFYVLLHGPLEPHNPVPKFLCIKAVLFLSFWQGVVIAGLVRLGMLPHMGDWTTHNVAMAIQEVLICVEMMLVAFAHRYAFPYQPYAGAPALRTGLLADHFAHQTALRDFNEVMPVLVLPTSFTPGLARSVDRGGGEGRSAAPAKGQAPLLDVEEGGDGLGGGPGRRLGTRQGVEAVGTAAAAAGGGGGSQQQKGKEKKEGNNENTPPGAGPGAGAGAGAAGEEKAGGGAAEAPAPLLGKGEALTLEKLPWRL